MATRQTAFHRCFLFLLGLLLLPVSSPVHAEFTADLSVTASGNPNPVRAGFFLTYSVTVSNSGPDTAFNASATYSLPTGTTLELISGCTPDPMGSSCDLGDIAAGSDSQFTIKVRINAPEDPGPAPGPLVTLLLSVSSSSLESILSDNFTSVETSVLAAAADLVLTQSDAPDPVVAGSVLDYTLTVTNNGPNTAVAPTVSIMPPPEFTPLDSGGLCTLDAMGLNCALGNIAAGGSQQIMLSGRVAAGISDPITSTASVSASTPEAVPGNEMASTTTQVVPPPPQADLTLQKTASVSAVTPGQTFDYTLTLENQGPDPAPNVVLTDSLPAAVTLLGADPACIASGSSVNCTFSSLNNGEVRVVTLTVQVNNDASGPIFNTAGVTTDALDADLSDNSATLTLPLQTPLALSPPGPGLPPGTVGIPYNTSFSAIGGTAPLTLSGSNAPPGLTFFDDGDLFLDGTPTQAGTFMVTVTVTDSAAPAQTLSRVYQLTIAPATPAALSLSPPGPALPVGSVGTPYGTLFTGSGGTAPLTLQGFDAPPGLSFSSSDGNLLLSGTPTQAGDFVLTVTLSDSARTPQLLTRVYQLTIAPPPDTLTLLPPGPDLPPAQENSIYGVLFTGSGGTAPFTLSGSGAPPGLTFFSNDDVLILGGIPVAPGSYPLTVTLSDSAVPPQTLTRNYTLIVTAAAPVPPPLDLSPSGLLLPPGLTGTPYSQTFASSGGTAPLSLTGSNPPPGLSFTSSGDTLTLSGTPTTVGEFVFTLDLSDSASPPQTLARSYRLVISAPLAPLTLLPLDPLLPPAALGLDYTTTFTGLGGTPPLSLQGSDAPPGLAFSTADGVLSLSGTPTQSGDFTVTVNLSDSASPAQTISRAYQLSVLAPLTVLPETLPSGQVGVDYMAQFRVADGLPPDTFTALSPLPPGLALTGDSLVGMPLAAGVFDIVIAATDSSGRQGQRAYSLEILPPGLAIPEQPLPEGVVGAGYGVQLLALGGERPYRWQADNALPPGLTLTDGGFIGGRPLTTGDFTLAVTVTDQSGASASALLALRITDDGLVNLTTAFPDGLLGEFYRAPILLSGGQPPYTCTLAGGELPPGLVIDGCAQSISGVPTAAGSFVFSIRASDSANPPHQLVFTAQIRIAADTPIPRGQAPVLNPAVMPVPVAELGAGRPDADLPDESLQDAATDALGNRYLVGFSFNGRDYDIRLLRYDPQGRLTLDQRFDSGGQDYGYSVAVSPLDQSVYVGGFLLDGNRYQALLLHFDHTGALQGVVRNGTAFPSGAFYSLSADDSGVYAAGERFNGQNFDGLIAKYSHAGTLLWETLRATPDTETAYQTALRCPAACELLVGGAEGVAFGRGWLRRLDPATGTLLSAETALDLPVDALALLTDGLVIGGAEPDGGWRLQRLTAALEPVWTTAYAPGTVLRALAVDIEGFVYAAGHGPGNGEDGLLVLFDGAGTLAGELRYDDGANERFSSVLIGPAGQLTVAGQRGTAVGNRVLLLDLDNGKEF